MFNFSYTVWNKDHAVSVTCMRMVIHNDVKANEIQLWVVHNYQHFLKSLWEGVEKCTLCTPVIIMDDLQCNTKGHSI